jgi:hypothetical protein
MAKRTMVWLESLPSLSTAALGLASSVIPSIAMVAQMLSPRRLQKQLEKSRADAQAQLEKNRNKLQEKFETDRALLQEKLDANRALLQEKLDANRARHEDNLEKERQRLSKELQAARLFHEERLDQARREDRYFNMEMRLLAGDVDHLKYSEAMEKIHVFSNQNSDYEKKFSDGMKAVSRTPEIRDINRQRSIAKSYWTANYLLLRNRESKLDPHVKAIMCSRYLPFKEKVQKLDKQLEKRPGNYKKIYTLDSFLCDDNRP